MTNTRLLLALVIALGWVGSWQAPGLAVAAPSGAQATLSVTARGGFGDEGSYLIGKWFPVRVTLTNPAGGASRRVRLEIDSQGDHAGVVTGTYVREVDMPAPSRKEVTLYTSAANFARNMEVRVVEGSTLLSRATVKLDPLEQATNMIIGVVSSDAALLNNLKGERFGHAENSIMSAAYPRSLPVAPTPAPASGATSSSPARAAVAHMTLEDIPTSGQVLEGLGALVLDDADTGALQEDQRQALADWVAAGGTLIAAAAPGTEGTLAGLGDLSPVQLNGSENLVGLDTLANWVAVPLTTTGSTLVPSATVRESAQSSASVPVSQEGSPLVVIQNVGRGQAIYLGLSPGQPPLRNWDGTLPLFRRLLVEHRLDFAGPATSLPGYYGYSPNNIFDTYGSVFDLPGLDLPSPMLIGAFLFVYILVVGPLNFIVLRRMKRTELAWATIPALVGLFSIMAYLLAYQSKGGDLVALRASVVQTEAGQERGTARQYLGLFSPTRGTYSLISGSPSLITEISAYGYGYGGGTTGNPVRQTSERGTTVSDIKINTWSLRGFEASTVVDATSPIEADLYLGDDAIEGTLRNRTSQPLQNVALIRGDSVQHITSIAPGGTAEVKLRLSAGAFSYRSPTVLMPTPPGVSDPTAGGGYGYNNPSASDEQRLYNRKVELLNRALSPVLSADPPGDMEVLVLAWGPTPPGDALLEVSSATARYDDLNLWLSNIPVESRNDAGPQPTLRAGLVPFTIYTPASYADWISGPPAPRANLNLKPYADVLYRLPAGTRPARLAFSYQAQGFTGEIEVLAHNVSTGEWDRVGALQNGAASPANTIILPNPPAYTAAGGDVTLRLNALSGQETVSLSPMDLVLNGTD